MLIWKVKRENIAREILYVEKINVEDAKDREKKKKRNEVINGCRKNIRKNVDKRDTVGRETKWTKKIINRGTVKKIDKNRIKKKC